MGRLTLKERLRPSERLNVSFRFTVDGNTDTGKVTKYTMEFLSRRESSIKLADMKTYSQMFAQAEQWAREILERHNLRIEEEIEIDMVEEEENG